MKIENLNLSVRAYNCLRRAGIETVEQLERMSDKDLLRLRNIGAICLAEIRQKVAQKETEKPVMTNGDRIRAMTDEELAEYLSDDDRCCPPKHPNCHKYVNNCAGCFLEWLQQPAEVPNA